MEYHIKSSLPIPNTTRLHAAAPDQADKPKQLPSLAACHIQNTEAKKVREQYIQRISSLSFSNDVMKERCFHLLPYDSKYLQEVLDTSDIVQPRPKVGRGLERRNKRILNKKHVPCHLKQVCVRLKPLKENPNNVEVKPFRQSLGNAPVSFEKEDQVFITQHDADSSEPESTSTGWDETLLSKVSSATARWIVSHQATEQNKQHQLVSFVNEFHGEASGDDGKAELIRETLSEADSNEIQDGQADSKWIRNDEKLLMKVRALSEFHGDASDDDADEKTLTEIAIGSRKTYKYQLQNEAGAVNYTAQNLKVKPVGVHPLPTLRDRINPAVGKYIYETDNMFQQDRLIGSQQVYDRLESGDIITTESQNKYRKKLQKASPKEPEDWYPLTKEKNRAEKEQTGKVQKVTRGFHRWSSLPETVIDAVEKASVTFPPQETLSVVPRETSTEVEKDTILMQIGRDWRNKWQLDKRYDDVTMDGLIRDMGDRHVRVRLKAVVTCVRVVEHRATERKLQDDSVNRFPEKLFVALECCLEDEHYQVQRAAAVALYTLGRPAELARNILCTALKEAKSVDRCTAAQCLAYYGECNSDVVGEIVQQLLQAEDEELHRRSVNLLVKLSETSMLVHSMLGEQLNSSSWKHRVTVCTVMSKLHGQISQDLVNKLTFLMWNDWHADVRKVAAQTLGKTGHGKDVHDDLRDKISHGNERSRAEAVQKVGYLGIMTAKLLPMFLQCLSDRYVSVRMEACVACCLLRIKDLQVLEKLVFLATFDAIWRVKALAFKAIGMIGEMTSSIRNCILWTLRYEKEPGVRAQACHTAVKLNFKDSELVEVLCNRFLIETSPTVRNEIARAFEMLGVSPNEDIDTVAQIKDEVRKLGKKDRICEEIQINEQRAETQNNIRRMIADPLQTEVSFLGAIHVFTDRTQKAEPQIPRAAKLAWRTSDHKNGTAHRSRARYLLR